MSFTRINDDIGAVTSRLQRSTSVFQHATDANRFEHKYRCRHELGIIDGPQASIISGNLVDLESDLRNQTRPASKCLPLPRPPTEPITIPSTHGMPGRTIDMRPKHLGACQMIRYPPQPLPQMVPPYLCPPTMPILR
jgi:hypothetical protein